MTVRKPLREFEIDPCYLTDITVVERFSKYQSRSELTPDEMVEVLLGKDRMTITSNKDHPNFAALREELGRDGFIKIERGWWNGDRVTKPFKLNGKTFRPGEQFSCAAAMKWHFK